VPEAPKGRQAIVLFMPLRIDTTTISSNNPIAPTGSMRVISYLHCDETSEDRHATALQHWHPAVPHAHHAIVHKVEHDSNNDVEGHGH
jgi:hypothetical protein